MHFQQNVYQTLVFIRIGTSYAHTNNARNSHEWCLLFVLGKGLLQENGKLFFWKLFTHQPSPQKKQNNMHESKQGYTVYNPTKHSHGDPKWCGKLHWKKNAETYLFRVSTYIPISQGPNVTKKKSDLQKPKDFRLQGRHAGRPSIFALS